MCTVNVRIDDMVMEQARPHFLGDEAMQTWIEGVLDKAMKEYVAQFGYPHTSNSESIYQQIKSLEHDPQGLFKLGGILHPSPYSAEELRDEYISEKYGV